MTVRWWWGVLAALALALSLLIPAWRSVLRGSPGMICRINLRQIGLAMHNYHDRHGQFPAIAVFDDRGRPLLSWRVTVLPFMGQGPLYQKFRLNEPWDSPHNKALLGEMPMEFACPLNEGR